MKKRKKRTSRVLVAVLSLVFAAAPQLTLTGRVDAQNPNGINMPTLPLRALGVDNEAKRIVSLLEAHVKLFKRGFELKQKSILSPRDAKSFFDEADARKADLLTIKREFESLINKLKQGNHWDEAFDAQVLASLKSDSARSALTQAGGLRKLFEAAVGEVNLLRDEIEEEVRQVNSKQVGAQRNQSDRVFAAHARPPVGKAGCKLILAGYFAAILAGGTGVACLLSNRFFDKGCGARLVTDCPN